MNTRYDTQSFQSYGQRLQAEARRARPAAGGRPLTLRALVRGKRG